MALLIHRTLRAQNPRDRRRHGGCMGGKEELMPDGGHLRFVEGGALKVDAGECYTTNRILSRPLNSVPRHS